MINIPSPVTTEAKLIVAAIAAICCFGAGWFSNGWRHDVEISDLLRDQASDSAEQGRIALASLTKALRRGDDEAHRAADLEAQLAKLSEGKTHEIVRVTAGRPCLGAAAVRVLNRTEPVQPVVSVPPAASEPSGTDAGFATDSDVSLWIIGAQRAYATCQGRIKAIGNLYPQEPAE